MNKVGKIGVKKDLGPNVFSFHLKEFILTVSFFVTSIILTFVTFYFGDPNKSYKTKVENITREVEVLKKQKERYSDLNSRKDEVLKIMDKIPKNKLILKGISDETLKKAVGVFNENMGIEITHSKQDESCLAAFPQFKTVRAKCANITFNIDNISDADMGVKLDLYMQEALPGYLFVKEASISSNVEIESKSAIYSQVIKYYWVYFSA
ncbi:hypothetical protein [Candidatus Deianiraea vastatrix]|nr:hypothetical protein [Candidatus Deianiraea vastatrix]